MAGDPVPDRATLIMLGQTIRSLQESFIAERGAHADDLALIRWETARLWGRIGRAALRSGAIGIGDAIAARPDRSEEHTSELQSLMRISYAVFCLKKKNTQNEIVAPQQTRDAH